MKTVTVEEFRAHVDQYLAEAEREVVLLTRDNRPCVRLRPMPSQPDSEADDLSRSPEFWQMVQERRKEKPIPWEDAKKDLAIE